MPADAFAENRNEVPIPLLTFRSSSMAERRAVNAKVAGSSPACGALRQAQYEPKLGVEHLFQALFHKLKDFFVTLQVWMKPIVKVFVL